jgi:hypothetical protein
MPFIILRMFPSIPMFLSVFYHRRVLDFVKAFYICRDECVCVSFILLMQCITVIDFPVLNQPCIPYKFHVVIANNSFQYAVEFHLLMFNCESLYLYSKGILICRLLLLWYLSLALVSIWPYTNEFGRVLQSFERFWEGLILILL